MEMANDLIPPHEGQLPVWLSPEGPLHVSAAVNPSFFYVKDLSKSLELDLEPVSSAGHLPEADT